MASNNEWVLDPACGLSYRLKRINGHRYREYENGDYVLDQVPRSSPSNSSTPQQHQAQPFQPFPPPQGSGYSTYAQGNQQHWPAQGGQWSGTNVSQGNQGNHGNQYMPAQPYAQGSQWSNSNAHQGNQGIQRSQWQNADAGQGAQSWTSPTIAQGNQWPSANANQGNPYWMNLAPIQEGPSSSNPASAPPPLPRQPGQQRSRRLDDSYKERREPHKFFVVGRVISVLWTEPAGPNSSVHASTVTLNYLNEKVYSKVRRMVVVQECHGSCLALAISTYRGQGVAKSSVKKSDHCIIYTGDTPPAACASETKLKLGENPMRPLPIRVVPEDDVDLLDPLSRINFAKIYTVEHWMKAKDLGRVHASDHHRALLAQWKLVLNGDD